MCIALEPRANSDCRQSQEEAMSFRSSSEKGLSNGSEFLQTQLLLGRALQKKCPKYGVLS